MSLKLKWIINKIFNSSSTKKKKKSFLRRMEWVHYKTKVKEQPVCGDEMVSM